tara:strand:+ start:4199 stop:5272 length:1074 start_codon:yes stop_codon:yes gene_type:complete
MELSIGQLNHLMERFPKIEHLYETISHNQVSSDYDLALAIPQGKKIMLWFTFHLDKHVCYLFELNRLRQIYKAKCISFSSTFDLSLGTILYGTIIEPNSDIDENNINHLFILEDIYYFKGININNHLFSFKLNIFDDLFGSLQNVVFDKLLLNCFLPAIWNYSVNNISTLPSSIPELFNNIVYNVHHIQYKTSLKTMPSLNVNLNKKINVNQTISNISHNFYISNYTKDFNKPQFKFKTIFKVSADIQFDIYHLFAFGKKNTTVFYDVAYIPNYQTSVFMNTIFRNIKENMNLDLIEESDDEEDFQNINEDKYVDLNKNILMECYFHYKFKKWVPIKIMHSKSKVIHINQLVSDFYY